MHAVYHRLSVTRILLWLPSPTCVVVFLAEGRQTAPRAAYGDSPYFLYGDVYGDNGHTIAEDRAKF